MASGAPQHGRRIDRLEGDEAQRPAPEYPLAHLTAESTAELHPTARDLLAAVHEHLGKPHTEATESECQAAFAAHPDALRAYLDHLLDVEAAEQSRDADGVLHPNIYTRTEES